MRGRDRGFGMAMYTLYLKWITNKGLLYTHGTLLNVIQQPEWEGNLGESGYVRVCIHTHTHTHTHTHG